VKYALSFSDDTLILIIESTSLLIKMRNSEHSLMITGISIVLQLSK